jgi:hypothetical protein
VAIDLEQAGDIAGTIVDAAGSDQLADPLEEGVELTGHRRQFGIGGHGVLRVHGWSLVHDPSLVHNGRAGHPTGEPPGHANPNERRGRDR